MLLRPIYSIFRLSFFFYPQQEIKIIYGWIKLSCIKKIKRQTCSLFLCHWQHAKVGEWEGRKIQWNRMRFFLLTPDFFSILSWLTLESRWGRLDIIRWYLVDDTTRGTYIIFINVILADLFFFIFFVSVEALWSFWCHLLIEGIRFSSSRESLIH